MKIVWLILRLAWPLPWSLLGLLLGLLALASGGSGRRVGNTLEFHGGLARWLLRRAMVPGGAAAITFGHVILGQTHEELDRCRRHERVHVRQYELWGPLFVPAYLLGSLVARLRGGNTYFDNPFEVAARKKCQ